MRRLPTALLAVGLTLGGCTVGPNFKPPTVEAPPTWGGEPADVPSRTVAGPVEASWWTAFNDPELTSLIDRLARQNLDLKAAAERIEQARAQRRIAGSQGLPHVEAQGFAEHLRASPEGILKTIQPAPDAPGEFTLYSDQAQVSWELDLFGRVRRMVEAQSANIEAMTDARRAIALSALAELAQDYLQLRGLQTREALLQRALDLAHHRQALLRDRFRNGAATKADVAEADAEAAAIAEDLPPLRAFEAQVVNALGLLLAETPRALDAELRSPAALPARPPLVPVGLPSELLRRRPDLRQAEARLHAATAEEGVAVADFFPQVSLNGSYGTQSISTSNLFSYNARNFMGGPSVTVPLFEGGRLRGELKLRKSEAREAALAYHQTVLQAWSDVDDALTTYAQAQRRRADIVVAFDADRVTLAAVRERYDQGAADQVDLVGAETTVLRRQQDLAEVETQLDTDLVTLYRALGGGWSAAEPEKRPSMSVKAAGDIDAAKRVR